MKEYKLKVIYHLLYGMNNYVLIWGDWLSCDPPRGSHESQSPHIWGWLSIMWPSQRVTWKPITPYMGVIVYHVTLSEGHMIANPPYKETLVPHLVATLLYFSQIYSYYIGGDISPLITVYLIIVIWGSWRCYWGMTTHPLYKTCCTYVNLH